MKYLQKIMKYRSFLGRNFRIYLTATRILDSPDRNPEEVAEEVKQEYLTAVETFNSQEQGNLEKSATKI